MNESVNPDNVNPHFDRPEEFGLYPVESKKVETSNELRHDFETIPVRPCPSCGHCPTCGRGPGYTYFGPVWRYEPAPFMIPCTTSGGEGATVTFRPIS
jgi:hypothetical protein